MSFVATLAAILSAILWGLAYVASGEALKKSSPAMLYLWLTGAIVALAPVAFLIEKPLRAAEPGEWKHLLVAGLSAAVALWLGYVAISRSSALQASIVDISYPLWAVLAGWLLYSQKMPNAQTMLGGGFILIGGALILFSEKP